MYVVHLRPILELYDHCIYPKILIFLSPRLFYPRNCFAKAWLNRWKNFGRIGEVTFNNLIPHLVCTFFHLSILFLSFFTLFLAQLTLSRLMFTMWFCQIYRNDLQYPCHRLIFVVHIIWAPDLWILFNLFESICLSNK
jgi:hypothetical protein